MKKSVIVVCLALLPATISFAQESSDRQGETQTGMGREKSEKNEGGLFVEPFLTYQSYDVKIKTSQLPLVGGDSTGGSDGYGLGARFGVHVAEVFFIAADARYAKPEFSESIYDKTDSDQYNYGLTVGAQTPIAGLRVWGTYLIDGRTNPESGDSGLDLRFEDLKGYRAGLGLYIGAVSANLEYQKMTYDTTRIQSWGSIDADFGSNVDTDVEGYSVSLGFPFTL
jgi:hypothetical protein